MRIQHGKIRGIHEGRREEKQKQEGIKIAVETIQKLKEIKGVRDVFIFICIISAMSELHRVYLALGANLGDRLGQLREALNHLRAFSGIEKISPCYETKPVGYQDQPDFLNLTCLIATELSPDKLLKKAKDIEKRMGRQASFRNAPRPIDIDILLFDDLVLDSPDLVIPHPRMNERAFVLAPLADIAPEIVHPDLHLTVREMLERVNRSEIQLFSTDLSTEVVESFYLETKDRLFFAVKGLEHPPDRWIAVLRYAPDLHGDRIRAGETYRRFYHFAEQEQFLKANHPEFIAYDPCFQTTLQSVPRSLVQQIHDPRRRLQELAQTSKKNGIEEDAVAFALLLQDESGAPLTSFGVSGSLLIGLQNNLSDLDISIFGEQNCHKAYQALSRLLDSGSNAELSRLNTRGIEELYTERSSDTDMPYDEFLILERRKVNQGRFRNRTYFVRFIKEGLEVEESYGQRQYRQVGRANITALIADDREAIFTPCRYHLSNARSFGRETLTDLTEIVSFRGRFCEQARAGETVAASGVLELVQTNQGCAWQRLLLGNFQEDTMVLRRE
jgi:2-amino-4-hydroxy-6-hydroxymethyldihydropteridine diphosphokinase